MAMGKLFSNYRKKVEEVRVSSLTPEEAMNERIQNAATRVDSAHEQIESLRREFVEMDQKHCLELNGYTLKIGKYSPGEPDKILEWWRDWVKRSHAAQTEFNSALSVWAGLKGSN
jgi:hypothetical protein